MLKSISAAELNQKNIPPIRWIVDGLIPQGLTILGGAPKVGKSWLALDLCLSVARGDPFWNKEVLPNDGDVLYLALEDSDRRIKSRMATVLEGRSAPDNLHFITEAPPIDGGLVEQMQYLFDYRPNTHLVVIDTLGRVRQTPSREGYQKDYAEMATLKSLADKQGCALVAVHHLRKMRSIDPFEMISGTNGIMGAADTALVLIRGRQSTEGRLSIIGRDLDAAEYALTFTEHCRWALVSEDAEGFLSVNDSLRKFLTDLDNFQGYAEELTSQFLGYCWNNQIPNGLSNDKPAISLSKQLGALGDKLLCCGKRITKTHTNKGTLITIMPL